jgi:hypothetical protein
MHALPQHGFGTDISFDKLIEHNRFLFRVYTPKSRPSAQDPFFLGAKFEHEDELPDYTDADADDSDASSDISGTTAASATAASYDDVIKHLDWTKRSTSPYISTSFSFAWAVWEACRRYRNGVKHDVHIAVIDAHALLGRAVTALELLRQGHPDRRHKDHWKFYRFASEAQDVLVFGCIPKNAVLSSVPLLSVLPHLPSYFLNSNTPATGSKVFNAKEELYATKRANAKSPFNMLAWNEESYTKSSYKQFCQDRSDGFLRLSDSDRIPDASTASARLAVALLRPWLHRTLIKAADTPRATQMLGALAWLISQWPAQWWTRTRPELGFLIKDMCDVVAEEVRESRRAAALREVERLQAVVEQLEIDAHTLTRRAFLAEEEARLERERQQAAAAAASAVRAEAERLAAIAKANTRRSFPLGPTASALVSGLLVGSFCVISIISSQSVELLHLT